MRASMPGRPRTAVVPDDVVSDGAASPGDASGVSGSTGARSADGLDMEASSQVSLSPVPVRENLCVTPASPG
ncbi:hypothetical protein GCM10027059_23110 [Myceligenerans halotolerans]